MFVLKHRGEYWAYCTGFGSDGKCFSILHSTDLVGWQSLGGAMEPLPGGFTCYWAPEAIYANGRFYLYYSAGNEATMQVRVAVADQPAGPFVDSGHILTHEPFAIDAHVFTDDDGSRYLFYATDTLEHSHIGTGTASDRMLDPFTLAGSPRPVTRARYDWQVYDPHRLDRDGVRWHTVEGPFVLKHKGRYYQMFSGGNWQNPSYGVGYAISADVEAPGEWRQVADGIHTFPILRSDPERGVIGPGHNSVVRGPDNRQLFCVYHRWIEDEDSISGEGGQPCISRPEPVVKDIPQPARVMAVDRLEWIGDRLAILGPTTHPQPAPFPPTLAFFKAGSDAPGLPEGWSHSGGRWSIRGGMAAQEDTRPGELSEARLSLPAPFFLLEVGVKALSAEQRHPGAFGLLFLDGKEEESFSLEFLPRTSSAHSVGKGTATGMIVTGFGESRREKTLPFAPDFESDALHTVRLEVNGALASLAIDEVPYWQGKLNALPSSIVLFTRGMSAAFSTFELTVGWEDTFWERMVNRPASSLAGSGWETLSDEGDWALQDGQLWHSNPAGQQAVIAKGPAWEAYEMVVNIRLEGAGESGGTYGFYPALGDLGAESPLIVLEPVLPDRGSRRWAMVARARAGSLAIPLPERFDPGVFQQFRFRKQWGQVSIQWEAQILGEIPVAEGLSRVGIYAHNARIAVDMARMTAVS